MARRKRKPGQAEISETIEGFARGINSAFEVLTGKSVATWFKEFGQLPRQLPAGAAHGAGQGGSISQEISGPEMPLADAYAVLGLPPTASIEEVERNYRNLAKIFHPDRGGYTEAMRLLNLAYGRLKKENKG